MENTTVQPMLKRAFKRPARLFKNYVAMSAVRRLASHKHPKVKVIGDALYESINNRLTPQERALISLIEERRSKLLRSNETIAVVDYGAGSGESRRTKEEMDSGVPSTALVADICKVSKPAFWATFLFKLIRKLEPSSCVELGSCVGISAAYQATALRLNGKGRLQTLEGSPEVARLAQETLVSLQLPAASVITGPFHKTFRDVLASAQPIDFFFNDGHHDHDAVMRYFEESLPHLSREAVMVFDDISWSPGMRKAWTEIEADKRVIASVDLQVIGVAVIGKSDMPREKFRIVLPGK